MGSDENLRKSYGIPMKPINYTWDLHLKRHEFSTEPVHLAGQRERDRQKGKEETDLISSLPVIQR